MRSLAVEGNLSGRRHGWHVFTTTSERGEAQTQDAPGESTTADRCSIGLTRRTNLWAAGRLKPLTE
jgi:hypothetical protein